MPIFSKYDDAIANAVSPFLTLGGVKGKSNKVRQTGRSAGDSVISRRGGADGQGVNVFANNADPAQHVSVTAQGLFRMTMPVAGVPFRPRLAYKALVKMGLALLPDDEAKHYTKLRAWLLDVDDKVDFPNLGMGMSFASVGNAPPIVVGALLRRTNPGSDSYVERPGLQEISLVEQGMTVRSYVRPVNAAPGRWPR
ncbi:hypothetical protein [Bradyrhizobium sp. CCBAU 51745]|uniref:hypothetical protein n=1 Tax=Bradyrhizobium sp. CCBAU 51745 TaxID=1325099 RepID=UPI0023055192|nr:hypothetical protein [Bradyrhizobium sp. CCBAU 51745]